VAGIIYLALSNGAAPGSAEERAIIVKQGLPYVRCVGEAWPLTQERVRYEAEALQTAAAGGLTLVLCPTLSQLNLSRL